MFGGRRKCGEGYVRSWVIVRIYSFWFIKIKNHLFDFDVFRERFYPDNPPDLRLWLNVDMVVPIGEFEVIDASVRIATRILKSIVADDMMFLTQPGHRVSGPIADDEKK
mgnify:CR=1 FL=1